MKMMNGKETLALKETLYNICLFCPVHPLWEMFNKGIELWGKFYDWKKMTPTGQNFLELVWWVFRKGWQWFLHAWAKKTSLLYYAELAKRNFAFQMTPRNELNDLSSLFKKIFGYHFIYGLGKDLAEENAKDCETK
jgi:hypothetical protein